MAAFGADVLSGVIVGAINSFIEYRKINGWVSLVLQMVATYVVAGSIALGTSLRADLSWKHAIGYGFLAAGGGAGALWTFSSLTKGMSLFVPKRALEQIAMDPELDMHEVKGGQKP